MSVINPIQPFNQSQTMCHKSGLIWSYLVLRIGDKNTGMILFNNVSADHALAIMAPTEHAHTIHVPTEHAQ